MELATNMIQWKRTHVDSSYILIDLGFYVFGHRNLSVLDSWMQLQAWLGMRSSLCHKDPFPFSFGRAGKGAH